MLCRARPVRVPSHPSIYLNLTLTGPSEACHMSRVNACVLPGVAAERVSDAMHVRGLAICIASKSSLLRPTEAIERRGTQQISQEGRRTCTVIVSSYSTVCENCICAVLYIPTGTGLLVSVTVTVARSVAPIETTLSRFAEGPRRAAPRNPVFRCRHCVYAARCSTALHRTEREPFT